MRNKFVLLICIALFYSCSDDRERILLSENLNDYLQFHSNRIQDEVIACAGNDEQNTDLVYVYYYPISGSTEFQYYETNDVNVDPNNFSNYNLKKLPSNNVLGNKLSRFVRDENHEVWGIVTFLTNGKIHKSNPIRLKHKSTQTQYINNLTVENTTPTSPKFSWNESNSMEDVIYFQAIVDENDNFISGTYTTERCFRYYDTSNVVLTINEQTPEDLNPSINYTMTVLGVSEDNWVNLYSEKKF